MQENLNLPDKKLFTAHLNQMEDSIFAFNRAIEVLERESVTNTENKIILITVIDALKAHIQFKRQLQEEGKTWLEKELENNLDKD